MARLEVGDLRALLAAHPRCHHEQQRHLPPFDTCKSYLGYEFDTWHSYVVSVRAYA